MRQELVRMQIKTRPQLVSGLLFCSSDSVLDSSRLRTSYMTLALITVATS